MTLLGWRQPFTGLVLAALLCVAISAQAADSLAETLARVATAYGAPAPQALRERGTTVSFRRGPGSLLRLYRAPDAFRIVIDYGTGRESRTMLGAEVWQQGKAAGPPLKGAVMLQAARIGLPWIMLATAESVVDRGLWKNQDGTTVRVLEMRLDPTLVLASEIDPESGRILRSRGIQILGNTTMEFATVYSDFRSVAGRLHAATEQHYAMGQHIGFSTIEQVDYPDSIPDGEFAP